MRTLKGLFATLVFIIIPFASLPAAFLQGQELVVTEDDLARPKVYSPYAGRNYPDQALLGDTHFHTNLSFDAGLVGTTLDVDTGYRFARGEKVISNTGQPVQLIRPLDFLVITDHAEMIGLAPMIQESDPILLADAWGSWVHERFNSGPEGRMEVFQNIIAKSLSGINPFSSDEAARSIWLDFVAKADTYNQPGRFTAMTGFEWTATPNGDNLHRVVIYRDDKDRAGLVEPYTTLPPLGSPDPRDLWTWMTGYVEKTGGQVLAIAHNGNLSNGIMFPVVESFTGKRVDREYAEIRAKWEPLYEATQIKGDGETHPFLSPNDEFADYETWDQGNLDLSVPKTDEMLQYEYARSALQIGLQLEQELGVNPYKFGFIGATDSHTGLATAAEENFFGKHSGAEPDPERWSHPMAKIGDMEFAGWSMVASGLAGVWATENTRAGIFDAMMRKETFATTGCRMLVRFFGGWDFTQADAMNRLPAAVGYAKGVPMGGDIFDAPDGKSPNFLVAALKDPYSGNLDRVQIVKVWVDGGGARHEKIYHVAWSGDRTPGPDGKLPSVGNTVDVASATWTNTIGAPELITVWTDPDFDPAQRAAYYARVIEIPTPRWTAYEAKRFGVTMPDKVPMTTQERAYTSPIWYTP